MPFPPVTLIIGGAASGKSACAEALVTDSGLAKVYVATAEPRDAEMTARIDRHRAGRAGQGWRTVEAPVTLPLALTELEAEEIALVDCATMWLSNLLAEGLDWQIELSALIEVFDTSLAPIVMVTNEIGQGIVPADPETRAFRDRHGLMNQRLADAADLVVLVTAGIPQILKGRRP